MKLYLDSKVVKVDLGWFSGENFKLFSFSLFEVYGVDNDGISIFDLQIFKFCFTITAEIPRGAKE